MRLHLQISEQNPMTHHHVTLNFVQVLLTVTPVKLWPYMPAFIERIFSFEESMNRTSQVEPTLRFPKKTESFFFFTLV